MAKKENTNKQLNIIREQIDSVDQSILRALSKRAKLVIKAGESKENIGDSSYYKPERETQIIRNLLSLNKSELKSENIKAIYREIISACFALEKEINIFYLGPKGTYSELAVIDHFGSSAKRVPCNDINGIFKSIDQENSFGVVPVENSSEGAVNQTLDSLQSNDLSICGELELPIKHSLIGKKIKLEKISTIYGHEQAIAQCKNWLISNMPNVKINAVESSGIALQKCKTIKNSAAIAHSSNAQEYNLNVLKRGIEDLKNNTTRFIVLGQADAKQSGEDKSSILISIENKSGALSKVLKIFESGKINLTQIQSRPNKFDKWQYSFFLDFEGHRTDPKIKNLISKLSSATLSLKLLGSYPKSI